MNYLAVKDLKKTASLWELLEKENELIITRDGKPCALMVPVRPETVERSLEEVRRARFSATLDTIRDRARDLPSASPEVIEREVQAVRRRNQASAG